MLFLGANAMPCPYNVRCCLPTMYVHYRHATLLAQQEAVRRFRHIQDASGRHVKEG